jgi:hypothetical protein
MRGHGSCNVFVPELMRFEMAYDSKGSGLGYWDAGKLTHHVWFSNHGGEHGPLLVLWMAYQNYEQLTELLSLIKSVGDQFHLVKLREPPGVQLQDLIDRPFKQRRMTRQGRFEQRARAEAYWQLRILDLQTCIAKTRLTGKPLRFNLQLSDPIQELLPEGRSWQGIGGSYVVSIGQESSVEPGSDGRLPTLQAQVGAFTRMWIGASRASALTLGDTLAGPAELIQRLDELFHLPVPHTDWDF